MKAVIVIEMSDKQWDFLHSADVLLMNGLGAVTVYPCVDIKPMPQKKNTDFHPNIVYANGWNDCLKTILGETE